MSVIKGFARNIIFQLDLISSKRRNLFWDLTKRTPKNVYFLQPTGSLLSEEGATQKPSFVSYQHKGKRSVS